MQGYLILNCVEKYNGEYRTFNYVFDNMTELIKKKEQFTESFKSTYDKKLVEEASSESRYIAYDSDGLAIKITITNQHTINVCSATIVDDDDVIESVLEEKEKTTIKSKPNAIKESKKHTWPGAGGEQ